MISQSKKCKICGEEKDLKSYAKHKMYKDNLDSRCKACVKKNADLRKELRKTAPPMPETCECCGKPHHKTLVLDHCHDTKEFRGWLCERCNTGIGKLGDNIEGIRNALIYLSKKRRTNEST